MQIELLYSQYQDAVRNSNVDDILRCGELYFIGLHGEVTEADKEQLQNDLLLSVAARNNLEF